MEKLNPKLIFVLLLLFFVTIPMFTSSLFDFEQRKEQEKIEQKMIEIEKALKENERRREEKIYLMGKFDQSEKADFVVIPEEYNISGYKMYLRKEALNAFIEMAKAASKDKINLKIISATRNFIYQKNLWNNKWSGVTIVDNKNLSTNISDGLERFKKILEYSATPGTSRHHWGSDIDINDANPQYFKTKEGIEVYEWLVENAPLFGFCQPYNKKDENRKTGYNEEKWHWSYIPLASNFTQEYKNLITEEDINGFLGDENVGVQNLIEDYVLGINPNCL